MDPYVKVDWTADGLIRVVMDVGTARELAITTDGPIHLVEAVNDLLLKGEK